MATVEKKGIDINGFLKAITQLTGDIGFLYWLPKFCNDGIRFLAAVCRFLLHDQRGFRVPKKITNYPIKASR